MQCKPVAALPAGEKWVFELKLDGYRRIAAKHGKEVTLFSRHKKVLNRRFPRVVDALASLRDEFVLDGELVVLDPEGRPSFQLLQGATSGSLPTYFYAFDVLHKNGEFWWIVPFRSAEPRWKASWPTGLRHCASLHYCRRHCGARDVLANFRNGPMEASLLQDV